MLEEVTERESHVITLFVPNLPYTRKRHALYRQLLQRRLVFLFATDLIHAMSIERRCGTVLGLLCGGYLDCEVGALHPKETCEVD
jgi:hypothetical protein